LPVEWELHDFGPCIAEWITQDPPSEWRRPVNRWVDGLRFNPTLNAAREPAIDSDAWTGWFCEVPDAGNAMVAVVVFYRISDLQPIVQCLTIESLPRYRE
jgi:hypothetical protein